MFLHTRVRMRSRPVYLNAVFHTISVHGLNLLTVIHQEVAHSIGNWRPITVLSRPYRYRSVMHLTSSMVTHFSAPSEDEDIRKAIQTMINTKRRLEI